MTLSRTERPPARTPSAPPEVNDARVRVRQLRAEAEATPERGAKAALLYESGYLHEVVLHQPAQAVQEYLAAYNADNRSRLPLHSLVRMFERRRSHKNLARLYDAELRSARSPSERSAAHTDQATLALFSGEDTGAVQAQLELALAQQSMAEPALLLEWNRRAAGDVEGAARALEKRAESCDDPVQHGALLMELAADREARGDLQGALSALRTAALAPEPVQEAYTIALARFARQHDFPEELVLASERRATRLAAQLREREREAEADPQLLAELKARAVAHWYEAARLRCTSLNDPLGALGALDSASGLAPDDPVFRQLRMLAYDLLEDRTRAADEARALLAAGLEGEQAAALHFRMAEQALVAGDAESARQKLVETIAAAGGSLSAETILDDLLLDEGRNEERIAQRETLASQGPTAAALIGLGEAAQIAAHELRDRERALRLYTRADVLVPGDRVLLREAYGSALELDDEPLARFALDRLLALELDPDERAALLVHRLELASDEERGELLDRVIAQPGAQPWLPFLRMASLDAATQRDYPRLSLLHELSAQAARDPESAAGELCAAARAALRAHDIGRARSLLEQALTQLPSHRYALTLLEEVLRQQGDAAGAIALLRSAAARHESTRAAEQSLLSAGTAAEIAGDFDKAAQNYLEAASREPPSLGALWALLRLAQKRRDRELERKARSGLHERERAEGRAAVDTVLLAEHYDLGLSQPGLAEPLLAQALADPDGGHHAALALLLSRSAGLELRTQALDLLATRATDSLRPALLRELGGAQVAHGHPAARVLDVVDRVLRTRPDDRWAVWTRTHTGLPHDEEGLAVALTQLAAITTDPQVADSARAEALWARQLLTPGSTLADTLASVLPDDAELGPLLAEMIVAVGSPAHDGAERTRAFQTLARTAELEAQPAVQLGLARSRLAQGDPASALTLIEELLTRDVGELAVWELAYEAAREAKRPELLARAAQQLAEHLDGEAALELLEEAALVRLEELLEPEEAEQLLVRVLAASPRRELAYRRLRDLYGIRGDDEQLAALIRQRTSLVDEPDELTKLYSELARLERKRGDLSAALDAVDNLLMLDDGHLGALALRAEIQTQRGQFREAVEALERLADSKDLPRAQRRIAGLGAADFLENKLEERPLALQRLERLLELEPNDASLHLRTADVAERLGEFERTSAALERAVALTEDGSRSELGLRHGKLLNQLGRKEEAVEVLRRVLTWAPDQVDAARLLLELVGDTSVLPPLEQALRLQAYERPRDADPLRKLRTVAELKGDRDLAFIALSTLMALEQGDEREARALAQLLADAPRTPRGEALTETELRGLLTPAPEGPIQQLLREVFSAAGELDRLEPGRFGVGRSERSSAKDPHPLRTEVRAFCDALQIKLGDLYVGGPEPTRVAVIPRDDEVAVVLGGGLKQPLSMEARHTLCLSLAAFQLRSLPLLSRTPAEAAQLLYAALMPEGWNAPMQVERDKLLELTKGVSRALSRRAKRNLTELARAVPSGIDLEPHCRTALARTRQLALALSGELALVLRDVDTNERDATELLRTWTSTALGGSRRKLGLAL